MILGIVFLALSQTPKLAPAIVAGASGDFQAACLAVERQLFSGDFSAAQGLMGKLPRSSVQIVWDDSAVPPDLKKAFLKARDSALQNWTRAFPNVKVAVAGQGAIHISFAKSIASSTPPEPAATHVLDTSATRSIRSLISLRRHGRPTKDDSEAQSSWETTEGADVHNEVVYALTSYYGIEPIGQFASFASRTDVTGYNETRLTQHEIRVLNGNMEVVEKLAAAVRDKTKLQPSIPKLEFKIDRYDAPDVVQGDPVSFDIDIRNTGNAPLYFRFQPDCGCLGASFEPFVAAGGSSKVHVTVNTMDFVGPLKKRFFVFANDPEIPYREFVVTVRVEPVYRMMVRGGDFVTLGDEPKPIEVLVTTAPKLNLTIKNYRVDGASNETTMEPWAGTVEDPDHLGGSVPASGYLFKIKLGKETLPGRNPLTLLASTPNEQFPILRKTFYVQKGVVALPDMIYFGQIGQEAAKASLLLSRPKIGFKITKIESNNMHISATSKSVHDDWEYKVTVMFDGKADFGSLDAIVTLHTDDTKQPTIKVPIRAVIQ